LSVDWIIKFLIILNLCNNIKLMTLILISYLYIRRWVKNYLHLHKLFETQVYHGLFHRQSHGFANDLPHNPLSLVYSTESFHVQYCQQYGRPCFISGTCAAFFELLYLFIHASFRQNNFSILYTKSSIGTRHIFRPQKRIIARCSFFVQITSKTAIFFLASQL